MPVQSETYFLIIVVTSLLLSLFRFSQFLRHPPYDHKVSDGRLLFKVTVPLLAALIIVITTFLMLSGWKGLLFHLCQEGKDFRKKRVLMFYKVSGNKYMLR